MPLSLLGTSILAACLGGPYHSWIFCRRRFRALLLEGFWTACVGAEVEGDSEPDMGDDADMGSTTETGRTKSGSEEFESQDLVELLEELKLEVPDEEQINKGARGRKVDVTVSSLSLDDPP